MDGDPQGVPPDGGSDDQNHAAAVLPEVSTVTTPPWSRRLLRISATSFAIVAVLSAAALIAGSRIRRVEQSIATGQVLWSKNSLCGGNCLDGVTLVDAAPAKIVVKYTASIPIGGYVRVEAKVSADHALSRALFSYQGDDLLGEVLPNVVKTTPEFDAYLTSLNAQPGSREQTFLWRLTENVRGTMVSPSLAVRPDDGSELRLVDAQGTTWFWDVRAARPGRFTMTFRFSSVDPLTSVEARPDVFNIDVTAHEGWRAKLIRVAIATRDNWLVVTGILVGSGGISLRSLIRLLKRRVHQDKGSALDNRGYL